LFVGSHIVVSIVSYISFCVLLVCAFARLYQVPFPGLRRFLNCFFCLCLFLFLNFTFPACFVLFCSVNSKRLSALDLHRPQKFSSALNGHQSSTLTNPQPSRTFYEHASILIRPYQPSSTIINPHQSHQPSTLINPQPPSMTNLDQFSSILSTLTSPQQSTHNSHQPLPMLINAHQPSSPRISPQRP
jgi:hypothetical protein